MVLKLTVFEYILNQLDDKETLAYSTVAKQHKISFLIGLLVIFK
jgi:hypothetical protein